MKRVKTIGTFEIQLEFESAVRFNSIRKGLADSKIFESNRRRRIRRCLPIARRRPISVVINDSKPLTALSGREYRLASSMSDHMPVV